MPVVQVDQSRFLSGVITPMVVEPVTLEGQHVRLVPLSLDHQAALCDALLDADIWRWFPAQVRTPDEMRAFIQLALKLRDAGDTLPFATVSKATNEVVGTTRFLTIERGHHHVEIGATIIGKNWQRTPVNTEAKYLMLRHAFETLGCIRVQFQTDSLNTKSQMPFYVSARNKKASSVTTKFAGMGASDIPCTSASPMKNGRT